MPQLPYPARLSTTFHTALLDGQLGRTRLFAGQAPLFTGTQADAPRNGDGEPQLTRAQWIAQEKAEQAKKSVDQLAEANAKLQWDLNERRRAFDPATQVALSKEDALTLAAYREAYPTPKEAVDAKKVLTDLSAKDQVRSYDEARTAALAAYSDLPDSMKALIPTAEEAAARPDGAALLGNTAFLKTEVDRIAKAYGATKKDTDANTDMGTSPHDVTNNGGQPPSKNESKEAAKSYYDRTAPKTTTTGG
jgi:hypothetical protein